MKKRMSRYWMVPGAIGLALAMAAVLAWASGPGSPGVPAAEAQAPTATPTATNTPTPTATPNAGCIPSITKSDSPTTVGVGGQITYTITVENTGTEVCANVDVTDTIPDGTDCVSVSVSSTPSGVSIDVDEDDCDTSGKILWDMDTSDELKAGKEFVLEMVVELEDDVESGDTITNEDACVTARGEADPADCDSETTKVGKAAATATPTTAPTPTSGPTVKPVVPPPVVPPVAAPLPTLSPPITGTGSGGDSSRPLAIGLGLAGMVLLLVSGATLVKRTR